MEIIIRIVEGIISLVVSLIEFIAGLFVEGAANLGGGESIALLLVLLIEFLFWLALYFAELCISLVKWRKPKKIPKPNYIASQKA